MPGNRARRLLQASRITPPLRGSRQDQGEARSRAGGGQTRRPVEPEGGKRRAPRVTTSRTGSEALAASAWRPFHNHAKHVPGVSPWVQVEPRSGGSRWPWAKTGRKPMECSAKRGTDWIFKQIIPGRQPLGSSGAAKRRQHLAVGVSPWTAMPHTPSREGGDSRWPWAKAGRKPMACSAKRGTDWIFKQIIPGRQPLGSSGAAKRRQHLAVGVSPWTAMPHTPSREGGDSRWPWAKAGRKPLESSRGWR